MRQLLSAAMAAALLCLPGTAGAQQDQQRVQQLAPGQVDPVPIDEQDRRFLADASASGAYEIQTSQMVIERLGDSPVGQLAKRMVGDHTKAAQDLRQIAEQLGIQIVYTLDAAKRERIDELRDVTDKDKLGRRYVEDQIEAHRQAIDLFRRQAEQGKNKELVAYARTNLPLLEEHLRMAQSVAQGKAAALEHPAPR